MPARAVAFLFFAPRFTPAVKCRIDEAVFSISSWIERDLRAGPVFRICPRGARSPTGGEQRPESVDSQDFGGAASHVSFEIRDEVYWIKPHSFELETLVEKEESHTRARAEKDRF